MIPVLKESSKITWNCWGIWAEDHINIAWIILNETKKYPGMIPWMTFLEFTVLLKRGIQYVDGTPPLMNILVLVTGNFIASKAVIRCYVLHIGHVIGNICGITSSHWPQVWINAISPENREGKHCGAGHLGNHVDRRFRYTSFIIQIDATI